MNERFDATPLSAMKSLTGVTPDSWGKVQALPKADLSFINDTAIPDSFDSETNWPKCAKVIGDIRDQSNCGCCWAFAGASAASDRLCIASEGKIAVPLSAQDVCFCSSSDGCQGGQIDTPWSYIASNGAVSGSQQTWANKGPTNPDPFAAGGFCSKFSLPHCHHHGPVGSDPFPAENAPGCPSTAAGASPSCPKKCDSDATGEHKDFDSDRYTFAGDGAQSASGEEGIQKAIMAGGPVETAFTVYADFANYASGIYHHVSGSVMGGHAVRIVGWGVDGGNKYWKVANSWNPYWGEKGYFRIKRGSSECGIEDGVSFSPHDAKWSKKGAAPTPPAPPTPPSPTPPAPPTPPSPPSGKTHYGDPADGCEADETAVKVQGLTGSFCSPDCKSAACPTDVPAGVTAAPQCALQGAAGDKKCALICSPSTDEKSLRAGDAQCGKATCSPIQTVGICTYGGAPAPPGPSPPGPSPPPPPPSGQCDIPTGLACAEGIEKCISSCKQGIEACISCLASDFGNCCPCIKKLEPKLPFACPSADAKVPEFMLVM